MCAAAVQAVQSRQTGLIDLDAQFCSWVSDDFKHELGDEASFIRC
jgi:hypothetical protein